MQSIMRKTFASDNYSGVLPAVMEALTKANSGHESSYGSDTFTAKAIDRFKSLFGGDTDVYFVYNGTGANVLALSSLTQSYHAVLCSDLAHVQVDESTAPEKFTGCKLLPIPSHDGKIRPEDIEMQIERIGDPHHAQPKVISISQPTEYATVYSLKEIEAITSLARKYEMKVHMDGSRIANAAVHLGLDFRTFTRDAGIDVLSFGGTKNGMMFGEAVLFFDPAISLPTKYLRKQAMQLHSKMRFIGAQFDALLSNDLWRASASHANAMAQRLATALRKYEKVQVTRPVDANGVFAILPKDWIAPLQEVCFFYVWNERTNEVRFMCAFDTEENEIKMLDAKLAELASV